MSSDVIATDRLYWKDYLHKEFPDLPEFEIHEGKLSTKGYLDSVKYSHEKVKTMCEECRSDQMEQHGKITIKCNGLASSESLIEDDYKHMFSEEELEKLEEIANPYHWADKNIDVDNMTSSRKFVVRWWQEQMTRCLHEDTMVSMSDGSRKKIKDVNIGDRVVSYNETKRSLPSNVVTNKWDNGIKDIYKIFLENGDSIECTDNHPILSYYKSGKTNTMFDVPSYRLDYKSIKEGLDVGMDVYTINKIDKFGALEDRDLAIILGYLATDGYVNIKNSKIEFSNIRKEYVDEIEELALKRFNCKSTRKFIKGYNKDGITRKDTWKVNFTEAKDLKSFLLSIGCTDKTNREMSILNFAYRFTKESLSLFVNRAYAGDGCIYIADNTKNGGSRNPRVSFHGQRSDFIPEWRELLRKIGIFSPRIERENRSSSNGSKCVFTRTDDIIRFFDFTGPIFGKEAKSIEAHSIAKSKTYGVKKSGGFNTSTRTKIIKIEKLGKKQVYDIEVANRHNFIANNIVVHNCTATRQVHRCGRRTGKTVGFAIKILHRALTTEKCKILVVTPYDVQAEEIFNTIREFIYALKEEWGGYKNIVKRDIKGSPNHLMQFRNHSRIRGFTTGSSGAGSVRGQGANVIVLDEVDYMNESDIDSILAILADNPNTELWMASTPKGKLILHKMENVPSYKHFHFPTYVLPHYNDELDNDFKEQLTDSGYVQEVIAEYGASDLGVFQVQFVDKAKHAGRTQEDRDKVLQNRDDYIVVMGCDWNDDQVGTRIMCVALEKKTNQFFVAESRTVSKHGWSQVKAIEEIIELNRRYKFEHMYVDEGFGTSQIQVIKQFAIDQYGKLPLNHPDLNLANIVGVSFGSKLELHDPETGHVIKKETKVFMVDNAVRFLEKGAYVLDPKYDKDLINQMYGYIIKSRSPSGRPVYGATSKKVGDHDLDAFMIAMYGFSMEYSELIRQKISPDLMQFVPRDTASEVKQLSENVNVGFINNIYARPNRSMRKKGLLNQNSLLYNRTSFGSNKSDRIPNVNADGEIFISSSGSADGFTRRTGRQNNRRAHF